MAEIRSDLALDARVQVFLLLAVLAAPAAAQAEPVNASPSAGIDWGFISTILGIVGAVVGLVSGILVWLRKRLVHVVSNELETNAKLRRTLIENLLDEMESNPRLRTRMAEIFFDITFGNIDLKEEASAAPSRKWAAALFEIIFGMVILPPQDLKQTLSRKWASAVLSVIGTESQYRETLQGLAADHSISAKRSGLEPAHIAELYSKVLEGLRGLEGSKGAGPLP